MEPTEVPPITVLDLGAGDINESADSYAALPADVPGSKVIAVDVEDRQYPEGWESHIAVIARTSGTRTFYCVNQRESSSLYPLDPMILRRYCGLSSLKVERTEEVQTVSLDEFARPHRPIHFIRIDIQGAEVEAFEGGAETLADVLMIRTEITFVPMYIGGALFRDVDTILSHHGFEFYDIAGLAHWYEEPFFLEGERFKAHQARYTHRRRILWADAIYVRQDITGLNGDGLRRLAALADRNRCHTYAASCIERYADRSTAEQYLFRVMKKRGLDQPVIEKGAG